MLRLLLLLGMPFFLVVLLLLLLLNDGRHSGSLRPRNRCRRSNFASGSYHVHHERLPFCPLHTVAFSQETTR